MALACGCRYLVAMIRNTAALIPIYSARHMVTAGRSPLPGMLVAQPCFYYLLLPRCLTMLFHTSDSSVVDWRRCQYGWRFYGVIFSLRGFSEHRRYFAER
ncbi:hypothetical protein AVEN_38054-1 [Araneus ventricosus]|uniref:Uncharacterized protein n=1 Tax=Araneus ventricosus TaxID=182803 RepID=A0A4Y2UGN6_ARAVE|nr:hypothetical protein AVEN_38054-1 [Araneus ventricosus]